MSVMWYITMPYHRASPYYRGRSASPYRSASRASNRSNNRPPSRNNNNRSPTRIPRAVPQSPASHSRSGRPNSPNSPRVYDTYENGYDVFYLYLHIQYLLYERHNSWCLLTTVNKISFEYVARV